MRVRFPLRRLGWEAAPHMGIVLFASGWLLTVTGCTAAETPRQASQPAAALDRQIDWTKAGLIVVQDGGRYKTLDSFARESFAAMTGQEHLPGLSPLASLLEWLFHRDAYHDTPLIKIKEAGVRVQLTAHLSEEKRQRILSSGLFTPAEVADPSVERVLSNLETQPLMRRAANRARNAQAIAERLDEFLAIVPQPSGDAVAPWFTPQQVRANLSDEQLAQLGLRRNELPLEARQPAENVTPQQAWGVAIAWSSLGVAWRGGGASGVQTYLHRLSELLPALAGAGVYPARSQRQAEVRYYALGKFTGGWLLYFVAFLISVWALVTRWRVPRILTMVLLLAGLGWHAYGLGLRWYILGRIPVANVFEAVLAAFWLAIVAALLLELYVKTRILLVAASAGGFLALVVAGFLLPGGELTSIPAILDHVQLRIHTVLISFSYALIFLAATISVIYLGGYYWVRLRGRPRGGGRGFPATSVEAADAMTADLGVSRRRPILAGASPGDEARAADLPQWLNDIDWTHLIILNLVFVMLFVGGVIMGAIWADVSWGRPWGWDPKEVFALNTWIIYAILIHLRFVVRNRGLWTAWLSIAGCTMMAFNWFFVNFFINSIHSYA